MAYSLSNKCAKNLCKRTVLVQLIFESVVACFLRHSVVMYTHVCVCVCGLTATKDTIQNFQLARVRDRT